MPTEETVVFCAVYLAAMTVMAYGVCLLIREGN